MAEDEDQAQRRPRKKTLGRSASTESTEYSLSMGRRSIRDNTKKKKPKERWLLTRKTWRYMADAGRRLIPEGAQNRPEDIPKIEAYFQEVCKKEPRFLLWRKNSYPGALGFRSSAKIKNRAKNSRKGGSCRKACSADEVDLMVPPAERPKDLALKPQPGGKFDLQRMKYDFLNKPPSPSNYLPIFEEGVSGSNQEEQETDDEEQRQLVQMLEQYLTLSTTVERPSSSPSTSLQRTTTAANRHGTDFNYQELVDKLQRHLTLAGRRNVSPSAFPSHSPSARVHFNGDHVQKTLSETLSRYFSQCSNRDRVISDLLTDRKTLEKLYFELRKTKGFRGRPGQSGGSYHHHNLGTYRSGSNYDLISSGGLGTTFSSGGSGAAGVGDSVRRHDTHPPPLIEVQNETFEITYKDLGIQTVPVPEAVLQEIEAKYKKELQEKEEEERRELKQNPSSNRRRSSVDNDDISQSVSDTIKRYLRMARKKSTDTDKVDRFKRVNYDRNLRNIKAKGEITKPGDDDGLNKGCQTNDDWILKYRDLKFDEEAFSDGCDSHFSSSRSSVDEFFLQSKSSPTSPPPKSSHHSFFSNLLHGSPTGSKHDKCDSAAAPAMQKSKSSSSVMHHGSRLMAKKIFRSRSKSQTRPAQATCSWTPQGGCVWTSLAGRQIILGETSLLNLTEIERKVLQKVALAKLQALNLGVAVKVPTEAAAAVTKPKRRYLLKRKALTTGIFDTSNRKDADKEGNANVGGLVFGIPLGQCVENDRISRGTSRSSPLRGLPHSTDDTPGMARHGSRSSFSSLDVVRGEDQVGSCESLMLRERIAGSVPGLLDALSACESTTDLPGATEEEPSVPNILTTCMKHIERHGLRTLGIFRVSTSKKRVRQLREDFDCGKEIHLDEEQCPHDVATLLKEYLRDLPDPLLCRDLYQAFVQTQRIRNRRLQFEALQHLVQLLPSANRDTLHALLAFLALVARHASDNTDEAGNKMDTTNLATVFAPNILHCIKPGSKDASAADRPEDRIDIINVVRTLIDHYKQLYSISPEMLDEIYVHMMDSHPEALDKLLDKRDAAVSAADESVEELDSESYSAPWTPTVPSVDTSTIFTLQPSEQEHIKKTYSREECLHEAAATGGPNVGMRVRHKGIRERSSRKRREDSTTRRRKDGEDAGSPISSGITSAIMSRIRGQRDDDYAYSQYKNRSSSFESTSSAHEDGRQRSSDTTEDGIRRKSSPYLLDDSGVITASLTIPMQTSALNLDDDIPYIEDVENGGRQQLTIGLVRATPAAPPRRRQRSISGSDSSVASSHPIQATAHGYDSAVGSSTAATTYSSPVHNTPSSSIADVGMYSSPPSWASTPPTSPDSVHTSVNYIPEENNRHKVASSGKVTFSSSTTPTPVVAPIQKSTTSTSVFESSGGSSTIREKFTPSISNIGNAVLRSKAAEFESSVKIKPSSAADNKKKYTKRRYTDSRHQTRHIPDSEALDSVPKKDESRTVGTVGISGGVQPVYKRRELISSVPGRGGK